MTVLTVSCIVCFDGGDLGVVCAGDGGGFFGGDKVDKW